VAMAKRIAGLLIVAAGIVACGQPGADSQGPSQDEINAAGGTKQTSMPPIIATAPRGIDDSILGAPVDRKFQRLQGKAGKPVFDASAVKKLNQTSLDVKIATISDHLSLEANVNAWMVNASGTYESTNRFDTYRAFQQTSVSVLDDVAEPIAEAPADAMFYVSKVVWGHSYEAVLEGSTRSFGAGLGVQLKAYGGSVKALSEEKNLKMHLVGLGLTPKTPDALLQPAEKLLESFEASAEPVPILVEYRLLPKHEAPANDAFKFDPPVHATVQFKTLKVGNDGSWYSTPWKLSVKCSAAGLEKKDVVLLDGQSVDDTNPDVPLTASLDLDGLAGDAFECQASGSFQDVLTSLTALPEGKSPSIKLTPGAQPLPLEISGEQPQGASYKVIAEVEVKSLAP
jgi:hypothetical protein